MPVLNRIAGIADEMAGWRQHLHAHPELGFECHGTAEFVAARLRDFGITEIETGIATSGVVAVIEGQAPGPTIGLRADMDALPITEATGLPYASQTPGVMHACGHDGHTTMLLGAAKYLAETRNFRGRVALIFQPAEENEGGAKVMCEAGLMTRFEIDEVYALHTAPGQSLGRFFTSSGPVMAAVDTFEAFVTGLGGHGAMPHETRDPIMAAVSLVSAIQTIVSRNHYVRDDLVISVTQIHAGTTDNVIPEEAYICGTIRSFDPIVQAMVERRMKTLANGIAAAYDVAIRLEYQIGYPATVNSAAQTEFACETAAEIVGEDQIDGVSGREMGAEDFAYMLQERPGAYLFLGQGDGPALHHPGFDFNDAVAPIGASYFARLVERALPLRT